METGKKYKVATPVREGFNGTVETFRAFSGKIDSSLGRLEKILSEFPEEEAVVTGFVVAMGEMLLKFEGALKTDILKDLNRRKIKP